MRNKYWIIIACFCLPLFVQGQMQDYKYQREISKVQENWHEIEIPNPMFGKVQPDLADLRVFGIVQDGDTIEAPYVLNVHKAKADYEDRRFRLYKQYWWHGNYYVIFEVLDQGPVNEIRLNFPNKNFDWKIDLEGSQNNHSWAHIIDDYRVVNVSSKEINYNHTTVRFPVVRYRYIKIKIPERAMGSGATAITFEKNIFRGKSQKFEKFTYSVSEDKDRQSSIIEIELPMAVPVARLNFTVENQYDFYRNVKVEYSPSSEWTRWKSLANGVISSVETPSFQFENTIVKKIRITVKNYDNEPLTFGRPSLAGDLHSITARFTEPAKYYLVYGNPSAHKPIYDLDRFINNIPDAPKMANPEEETLIFKPGSTIVQIDPVSGEEKVVEETKEKKALLENKIWLWAVMGIIIVLLGFFTLRMMRD